MSECGQVVPWVLVLMCHCVVCFPVAFTGSHITTPFPARLEDEKKRKALDRHYQSVTQTAAAQPTQP